MKRMPLVGRERERMLFHEKMNSGKPEFIAVYGRRRVGKTFLIRHALDGKFTFRLTGMANATLSEQLANFNTALKEQHPGVSCRSAKSWMDAFQALRTLINRSAQKRKVIFFDELPWFDTPHSGFIRALEHFWNSWASARKDIVLIVCGSAASWMIHKLINNRGGLHNRVTQKIRLEPFTLGECSALLATKKIALDHYQLVQLYMALGGIPYYWDALRKGFSAAQNIDRLCFEPNGLLRTEFANLYRSLFSGAERHEAIVLTLAKKSKGLTREEISRGSGIPTGGGLTRLLEELEESGFIRRFQPFDRKSRNSLYQLCDFFTLFHLRFIRGARSFDRNHWLKMTDSPAHRTWSGYAFEQVCLAHIP